MKTPIYTGLFQSDLDANGYKISGLHTPTLGTDAATKAYVDAHPGGGGGGSLTGIFNVVDAPYNATGDGVTNDTTALQDAIDAAEDAGGGVVFLPAGTYLCGALTLPKTVTLTGVSMFGSVIKASGAGVLLTHTGTDLFNFANYFVTLGGPTLTNLTLDGNSVGTDGVFYTELSYAMIRDVMVKNFTGKGFRFEGAVFLKCDNCRAHHNAYGFYYKETNPSTVYGPGNLLPSNLNVIQNSMAFFNTTHGIHFEGSDGLHLVGCDIESNGTNGNAATGGVYIKSGVNFGTTGMVMDRCWVEAQTGGFHVKLDDVANLSMHSIRDTTFLDFVGDALSHAIVLGGIGAVNQLDVTMSAAMPSRAVARDINGTGSNAILTRGAGYYFTESGTFGLSPSVYVGADMRLTPISGGAKLEARNTGTGVWVEAARWTNP